MRPPKLGVLVLKSGMRVVGPTARVTVPVHLAGMCLIASEPSGELRMRIHRPMFLDSSVLSCWQSRRYELGVRQLMSCVKLFESPSSTHLRPLTYT